MEGKKTLNLVFYRRILLPHGVFVIKWWLELKTREEEKNYDMS